VQVLERIIETATWAPSAHNRQPWRIAVLSSLEAKTHLADDMGEDFRQDLIADGLPLEEIDARLKRSRDRLLQAPVALLLCLDLSGMDVYPDQKRQNAEYLMGVQSVALAGGTLLLAAHSEGLGGVWICAPLFAPETVCRSLNLPSTWQPQGILLLGYPESVPTPPPRLNVNEIMIRL
jgi:F420 biosynthesis protein FbiB-like protein